MLNSARVDDVSVKAKLGYVMLEMDWVEQAGHVEVVKTATVFVSLASCSQRETLTGAAQYLVPIELNVVLDDAVGWRRFVGKLVIANRSVDQVLRFGLKIGGHPFIVAGVIVF